MKHFCQIIAFGLVLLLCCALLSACTEKPAVPETPQEPVAEVPAEQPPESPAQAPQPEAPAADPLDFQDEEALREYLVGTWEYCLPENSADADPVMRITLCEDGSSRIETKTIMHNGVWIQTPVNAKDGEPMDGLHLSSVPGDDAVLGGDFRITGWGSCDGEYLIHLSTLTGDPNVFSLGWGNYDATLRKQTDEAAPIAVGDQKRDAHFNAICWKVSEDQRTMWLDDVSDDDIYKNEGRHEAIPYVVREDYEPR